MKHIDMDMRGNTLLLVLTLGAMLGCQGVSAVKPASQTPLSGQLTAAPASVSFGNLQVGASQTQSGTLTNAGGSSLSITSAVVTGTGFSVTGLNLPLTLAAGQTTTFSVVCNPQTAGVASGTLAVTNNSSNIPLDITLSGTAMAAGSLATTPASFSFGNVLVGGSATQTETLKNSGGENLTISQIAASGAGFSYTGMSLPLILTSGQSFTFAVFFSPVPAGASNGTLSITSSESGTPLDLALSGVGVTPATLTATPASVNFTSVQAGKTQSQTETLQNTGGSSATISQVSAAGTGFSVSGLSAPLTLAPGQSTSFSVTFAPQTSGTFSGSIAVASNASDSMLTIASSGTATGQAQGQLSASPSTISVGNVTVGTSGTQTGSLTATGASVTVSSVSLGGSEFLVSGVSFPATIAAGQSLGFTVTFTPQSSGLASVSASFVSDASNSPASSTVTGTGVAAPVHSVSLSWIASTSTDVSGYNIYRRTGTSGSYVQINTVLNSTTGFTDPSVTDGQTYYYETTAVNSSNEESAPSPAVSAVIPAP
jgi:hypothetical protein